MAKKLRENITSDYMEAANRLNSKKTKRRIVAYVESYDDVFFWRTVFSQFENDQRYFEVMLPSRHRLERGKKSVLMRLLAKNAGSDLVCCVDADYDYLIQGVTETSRTMLGSPYVFHTYAYAIENLQCYAPSLRTVCVAVTLNDHEIFDFNDFLAITDFNKVIELGGFNLDNPMASIKHVRRKVYVRVGDLQKKNPDAKESYLDLKRELIEELGVTPQTTYLYIQGHHLFEKLVLPVMGKVCARLIRDREMEIRRQSVHSTQMRNELSCYSHSTQDIAQMLKKNMGYLVSDPFRHILSDVQMFFTRKSQGTESTPTP